MLYWWMRLPVMLDVVLVDATAAVMLDVVLVDAAAA